MNKHLAVILFIIGGLIFLASKGAVHEIEAILLLLCGLVVKGFEKTIEAIKESKGE